MDQAALVGRLRELLAKDAELDNCLKTSPQCGPAPEVEWVQRVFEICKPALGETPEARTDAANLLKVYAGAPTVVLGTGGPRWGTRPTNTAASSASPVGCAL
jgi:hypothetical protein